MIDSDVKIPTTIFRAQVFVQRARYHDHREEYAEASKYYLEASKFYTLIAKKFPHLPIRRLCLREAKLATHRARDLHQTQRGCPPDPPLSSSTALIDQQEVEMRNRILRCRLTPDPTLTWDDIIGLDRIRLELVKVIFLPLKRPELLTSNLKIPRSVLLVGPPGCGKTHLVRVIASQARMTFFNISAGTLLSKWQGESQKMIRVLYETAWEHAPSIIFIDEFDALFGASTEYPRERTESSRVAAQVQKELQQYMDGIHTPKVNETVTIAATNFPWHLEVPQIRRFDRRLYVPPPRAADIVKMLQHFLRAIPHNLSLTQIYWLAYELVRYTPDEIRQIIAAAYYRAYERACNAKIEPQIELPDLTACKTKVKPILELRGVKGVGTRWFREWNEQFGFPVFHSFEQRWEESPFYSHRNPIKFDDPDPT